MAELKVLLTAQGGDAFDDAFTRARLSVERLSKESIKQNNILDDAAQKFKQSWTQEGFLSDIEGQAQKAEMSLMGLLTPIGLIEAGVASAAIASTAAFAGLAVVFDKVIVTGEKFDRIGVKMDGVFGVGGPGDKALKWAEEFKAKVPMDVEEVTNRMIRLKRAGFDPLDEKLGLMTKFGDTAQALGISFDTVVAPLARMNATGSVTGKMLKNIAEDGIPVFQLLAEKTGMSEEALLKLKDGMLDGRKVALLLADAMGTQYAGSMDRATQTAEIGFMKIGDAFEGAAKMIGDKGVWADFTAIVQKIRGDLEGALGSGTFDRFAQAVSNVGVGAIDRLRTAIFTLREPLIMIADMTTTGLSAIGALLDSRKSVIWDLSGGEIEARADEMLAKFGEQQAAFYRKKREMRDKDKNGIVETITFLTAFDDNATKAKIDNLKSEQTESNEIRKMILKEGEKEAKEIKARQKDIIETNFTNWKNNLSDQWTFRQHDLDLQKRNLNDQVRQEEDRMKTLKESLDNRQKWEKSFWDFRRSLADSQFNREQDRESTNFKRRLEDEKTAQDRSLSDIERRALDQMSGKTRTSFDAETQEVFRRLGFGSTPEDTEENRKKIERFFQDKEKQLDRSQEDQAAGFKQAQEDVKREREFVRKQEEMRLEEQTKAMIELATSMKNFKAKMELKMRILDEKKFVEGFMVNVFQRAGVVAKAEAIKIAGAS